MDSETGNHKSRIQFTQLVCVVDHRQEIRRGQFDMRCEVLQVRKDGDSRLDLCMKSSGNSVPKRYSIIVIDQFRKHGRDKSRKIVPMTDLILHRQKPEVTGGRTAADW